MKAKGHGPILILAGMHRSGTSFVSSRLQDAGLDMGERLLPGADANIKGFFENMDFVELHESILASLEIDKRGWTLKRDVTIPKEFESRCQEVINKNSKDTAWGWKDPRTTLFLESWHQLLPQAKVLFLYRSPWEVVDSLFRRGDKAFQEDPSMAVKSWEHYNRVGLEFNKQHPESCLIMNVSDVIKNPSVLFEGLQSKLDLTLRPASNTFDQKLFREEPDNSSRPKLIRTFFPSAFRLWLELQGKQSEAVDIKEDPDLTSLGHDVLVDWMEMRKAQKEVSKTNQVLSEVRNELFHSKEDLQYLKRSRVWQVRDRLVSFRALLKRS
ncbi:MAG: sulfotransferase [Candidatus Melainabacteria bacterium]|nr:sulfotransferase [Candidatus Melainabacteria bacterium]